MDIKFHLIALLLMTGFIPLSSGEPDKKINIEDIATKSAKERYTRKHTRSLLLKYLSQQNRGIPPASEKQAFDILKAKKKSFYVFDYILNSETWPEICQKTSASLQWIQELLILPDDESDKFRTSAIQSVILALTVHSSSDSQANRNLRILISYAYLVPCLKAQSPRYHTQPIALEAVRAAEICTLLCRQGGTAYDPYAIDIYGILLQKYSLHADMQARFAYWLAQLYLDTHQYKRAVETSKLIPSIEGMKEAPARIQKQALQQYNEAGKK